MKTQLRAFVRGAYDLQKIMPAHKDKTKMHRHNMSVRYAVKLFIVDLYMSWRELEGLAVYGTYAEEKLGIVHKKVVNQ